jgi:hypothetical protein
MKNVMAGKFEMLKNSDSINLTTQTKRNFLII